MTMPVLGTGDAEGYRLSFVLPNDIVVPTPSDARVELKSVASRRVAALRFHGRHEAENLEAHKQQLARAVARASPEAGRRGDVRRATTRRRRCRCSAARELWVEVR